MESGYVDCRLCKEIEKPSMAIREYLAWEGNNPVDRFQIFKSSQTGYKWMAWTGDTISSENKSKRILFVEKLNGG